MADRDLRVVQIERLREFHRLYRTKSHEEIMHHYRGYKMCRLIGLPAETARVSASQPLQQPNFSKHQQKYA